MTGEIFKHRASIPRRARQQMDPSGSVKQVIRGEWCAAQTSIAIDLSKPDRPGFASAFAHRFEKHDGLTIIAQPIRWNAGKEIAMPRPADEIAVAIGQAKIACCTRANNRR